MGFEINFDGLVGNTHHYGGLSFGNIASMTHEASISNPKRAALQGLQKMKFLSDLGLKQAVLPPQQRPDFETLRSLGFEGSPKKILEDTFRYKPELLSAVYSASSMWTANAATVSPSADTGDHRVHFTPANLCSKFHRSIEPSQTGEILKAVFRDDRHFVHHKPIPAGSFFGDEGAANHTRFCETYGEPGLELFVFGRYSFRQAAAIPKHFPARQTYEASQSIARLHRLRGEAAFFCQQNAEAIDAGAFHNDVVSVGNRNFFFCHEHAFFEQSASLAHLKLKYHELCGGELNVVEVSADDVSLKDAIGSYLFNSQIVSLPDGTMSLIAPLECREVSSVHSYLESLIQSARSPVRSVHYLDLRESMRNGGGPACLRLRVVLTQEELAASNPGVHFNDELHRRLTGWVEKNYRDRLMLEDLRDPRLAEETEVALDELTQILSLGSVYPFQR